jgi:hypothetical protein
MSSSRSDRGVPPERGILFVVIRIFCVIAALFLTACSAAQTCTTRGGRWLVSDIDVRLPGACIMPAVDVGQSCTHAEQCHAGYCACPFDDAAAAIRDGGSITGECPEFPARPSDGWLCSVENGLKREKGVLAEPAPAPAPKT